MNVRRVALIVGPVRWSGVTRLLDVMVTYSDGFTARCTFAQDDLGVRIESAGDVTPVPRAALHSCGPVLCEAWVRTFYGITS